jgi:hypothetical protein
MFEPDEQLSPQGIARREEILRITQGYARGRRIRRRAARTIAGSCVAIVAFAIWVGINHPQRDEPTVSQKFPSPSSSPTSAPQYSSIDEIQTDPEIANRLALKPGSPKWTVISDDELLATLAQTGQPAGLITTGDETVLVSQQSPEQ